jgi:serine/threonine-protein kinase
VYLAEDLKHHRKVAIKVLRPELAAVIGAARFLREIQTIANLQHSHILGLIDSGEVNGTAYYVMPFVEGESLRDRLTREKQLPIGDAVRIATEVASALDYAHRHGVIHRDIKPENILLHDGSALVADFGIALAASKAGTRMTETGMSLGTPHYMSPEQAMGEREIGPTSDVYALGCVTYEMLAGEPPFTGPTAQAIIARVVTEEPRSLTLQRRTVPPHVEAAVNQALAKVPADRFTTAREFVDALHGRSAAVAASAGTARPAPVPAPPAWRQPLVLALAVGLAAALTLMAFQWRAAHREQPSAVVRFTVPMPSAMLTTNAALGTNLALSPDGRMLVHAVVGDNGAARLVLRPLDDATGRAIPGTDGAQQPCFSPDGQWVAYLVGNVIWKVQVDGGRPVMVGPTGVGPVGLSWAKGGSILVGTTVGLLAVPSAGGSPKILAAPDSGAGDLYFIQPQVLADGVTVLFGIQPAGGLARTTLGMLSLKTGAVTRVNLGLIHPLGVIDGTLVYVTPAGALSAVKFDAKTGRTTSSPVALGPNIMTTVAGASEAALSASGTLAYQSANTAAVVGWADLNGGFQPVLTEPQTYTYPRLSPDGTRIAMSVGAGGRSDIWVYDIRSSTPSRLTNSGTLNDRPEWTPDGKRVLYRADRGNRTAIWWQPADLSEAPVPLLVNDRRNYYEGVVSPDGRTLAYQVDDGGAAQADVMFRPVSGDTASHPVAASEFVEAQPRISPDGRWIAYVTDASGISEVVVQPFPGPGARVQVSAGGGSEPVWSRDGRHLYYRDGRHLIAATVSTTGGFAVTGRSELFADTYMFAQAPHANYDVSPDGTRFLMVKSAELPELLVVHGWRSELQARMRGAQGH